MSTGRPAASIEEIAALLDGRLEGAERDAVLEALARDEESFELFEESVQALEEESEAQCEPEGPAEPGSLSGSSSVISGGERFARGAEPKPPAKSSIPEGHSSPSSLRPFLAWAAVIAIALIGGFFWQNRSPSPAESLLAAFEAPPSSDQATVATLRSKGSQGFFLAGTYSFAATAALGREDSEAVVAALGSAAVVLSSEDVIGKEMGDTAQQLDDRTISLKRAARQLRGWDKELSESNAFALGRWYQAAAAAEAMGDLDFFSRPVVHEQWDEVYEKGSEEPELWDALEQVNALLAEGVSEEERESLRVALRTLLQFYRPQN